MALLTTLEANHGVRLGVITIQITIGFTRGHCVTCFLVRRGVGGSGLITRVLVLLFGQRWRQFLEIAISVGLPASWKVRVLFWPITRIATKGCVDCNSARGRATGV